jgi:SAM-dependent methyltransferase
MIPKRAIEYLSAPSQVSMADQWFEIASVGHFWIRRRFDVLQRLAGDLITGAHRIGEVGCGHGLLQLQVEESYDKEVTGFDLNEFALKQNQSRRSAVCCYDICQKSPALRHQFDLIFLFDVLEHIEDEDGFLAALRFHLAPKGRLIINVPAGQWVYSAYDRAAGHVRRYLIGSLQATANRNNFAITHWTYWGLPLTPLLLLRKVWLLAKQDKGEIISAGFSTRTDTMNQLLRFVSKFEPIPQRLLGTSLMAVLQFDGHQS